VVVGLDDVAAMIRNERGEFCDETLGFWTGN
jgi:hypothetical protein